MQKKKKTPQYEYKFEIAEQYNKLFRLYIYVNDTNVFIHTFSTIVSSVSCGVKQLYGLPLMHQYSAIDRTIKSTAVRNKILQEGFKAVFDKALTNWPCANLVISNYGSGETTRTNAILTKICQTRTKRKTNPNSGNGIYVWVY